jgi:hypothetical protein
MSLRGPTRSGVSRRGRRSNLNPQVGDCFARNDRTSPAPLRDSVAHASGAVCARQGIPIHLVSLSSRPEARAASFCHLDRRLAQRAAVERSGCEPDVPTGGDTGLGPLRIADSARGGASERRLGCTRCAARRHYGARGGVAGQIHNLQSAIKERVHKRRLRQCPSVFLEVPHPSGPVEGTDTASLGPRPGRIEGPVPF